MAANRNEDYHQPATLGDANGASYTSFKINTDGSLTFADKIEVGDFHKPTQIHASKTASNVFFGNNFQVDVDFDAEGGTSFMAGPQARIQGDLRSYTVDNSGKLSSIDRQALPETIPDYLYIGVPDAPTAPLGIWDHPQKTFYMSASSHVTNLAFTLTTIAAHWNL